MGVIRIVVADDHVAMRQALASYLDGQKDMEVVAEASDGEEAIAKTLEMMPDVLLIDITMPRCTGIEAIARLREQCPAVRALVLTMHDSQSFLRSVLAAGGAGYVTKGAAGRELVKAIREVAGGRSYINVSLDERQASGPAEGSDAYAVARAAIDRLSDRERDVLGLVAHGYTSKEIAEKLDISRSSVDTYRDRIAAKLGIKNRVELVRYALDAGLLAPKTEPSE